MPKSSRAKRLKVVMTLSALRSGGRRTPMPAGQKKNNETHYGYTNHINADAATKLIQD